MKKQQRYGYWRLDDDSRNLMPVEPQPLLAPCGCEDKAQACFCLDMDNDESNESWIECLWCGATWEAGQLEPDYLS